MFLFGTTLCANAQESLDVYGISLGSQSTEQKPDFNPLAALEGTVQVKPFFEAEAEEVTDNSAVICWQSENSYISYTLSKFNIIMQQWEEYLITGDCRVTLTDLREDTDYEFAIMNSATNEILGTVSFTTGVKKAEVVVKNRSSKQIELGIKHTDSAAKVYLYKSTDGEEYTRVAEVTDGTYIDTDVQEATKYYYKVKCVNRRGDKVNKSAFSKAVETMTLKSFGLPEVSGETKTYAYYTAVTAKSTPQYKLLRSEECYTDEETGIRMVDGFYCVALGSYYGTAIGTKYKITLEGGKEINVILCDQKSNRHTDENHQYARRNKDIVEFYVEKHKIPKGIRGDFGKLEQFSGKIISIEQYMD